MLKKWGSLSITSMAFFEWYHKFIKADAGHVNNMLDKSVGFMTRAAQRRVLALLPQLMGEVKHLDTLDPADCLRQVVKTPVSALPIDATTRAYFGAMGGGPLVRASYVSHYRVAEATIIAKTTLRKGDRVRHVNGQLYIVDDIYAFTKDKTPYICARALTRETDADRPAGAPHAYSPDIDTHVLVARSDKRIVFPSADVWNKIFAPPHIELSDVAALAHERAATRVALGRFSFSPSHERTALAAPT